MSATLMTPCSRGKNETRCSRPAIQEPLRHQPVAANEVLSASPCRATATSTRFRMFRAARIARSFLFPGAAGRGSRGDAGWVDIWDIGQARSVEGKPRMASGRDGLQSGVFQAVVVDPQTPAQGHAVVRRVSQRKR